MLDTARPHGWVTKHIKSSGVPERELDYRAEGRTTLALRFLLADARQGEAGVNVERPQPLGEDERR